jgi:DNA-binding NarL/FixJ family response regulator
MPIRVLLADDNELARRAIKFVLAERQDLKISAEAVDGEEAVLKAKNQFPDLAIIDIEMPIKNGIQAAKEILKCCPRTVVLMESLTDVHVRLKEMKEAGAKGFVSKMNLVADLIPAIDRVLRGETSFGIDDFQPA